MKIVIMGNTNNFDFADALMLSDKLEIIGGIIDYSTASLAKKQKKYLHDNNILEVTFADIETLRPDFVIILTYWKIIPTQDLAYFRCTTFLNIHGGILPKYRGLNANPWAILNNSKLVGYTLQLVAEDFDAGDIYEYYTEEIKPTQKYGEIIPLLRKQVCDKLPDTLIKIKEGNLTPTSQKNQEFLYTTKFKKTDGILKDWNVKSEYIYNLYRVMGAPYGTGVFFENKGNLYEIQEMSLLPHCPEYFCIQGAIVNIQNNAMWVKTKDTAILIEKVTKNGEYCSISEEFKIGQRL